MGASRLEKSLASAQLQSARLKDSAAKPPAEKPPQVPAKPAKKSAVKADPNKDLREKMARKENPDERRDAGARKPFNLYDPGTW